MKHEVVGVDEQSAIVGRGLERDGTTMLMGRRVAVDQATVGGKILIRAPNLDDLPHAPGSFAVR